MVRQHCSSPSSPLTTLPPPPPPITGPRSARNPFEASVVPECCSATTIGTFSGRSCVDGSSCEEAEGVGESKGRRWGTAVAEEERRRSFGRGSSGRRRHGRCGSEDPRAFARCKVCSCRRQRKATDGRSPTVPLLPSAPNPLPSRTCARSGRAEPPLEVLVSQRIPE